MFKKTILAGSVVAALGSGLAQAQAPTPAEPASPHTITGNVGLYSQYIFRGLTQTERDPALQGGFDYSHSSGFYVGTWASNISWLKENFSVPGANAGTYGQGGSLEWDFYGGWKWGFAPDFTLDLGTLYYWYPGKINPPAEAFANSFGTSVPKADTWEVYAGLSWKWLSGKFSYAVKKEVFGNREADGTWYLDLSANVPLGDFWKEATGLTVIAHWGYQKYRGTDPRNAAFAPAYGGATPDNDEIFSYKDWKLGLSYALPKDFTVGGFYTKVYGYNKLGYGGVGDCVAGVCGVYPRDIAKDQFVVYLQKTF
jgi:uncharacterized protein (TIGR02001 family)